MKPKLSVACNRSNRRSKGFTLVEMLVVLVIIAALAALGFLGYSKARITAAKTVTISDMRQIGLAATVWGVDNNLTEPFYAANGTGTYSHEAVPGPDPKLAPGNPATALYDADSPNDSYLADYSLFFNPLTRYKTPSIQDYNPTEANEQNLWGTYAWYYPSVTRDELSGRQTKALYEWAPREYSRAAKGKLLMAPDYRNCEPTWDRIYLALMKDGSVIDIGKGERAWTSWLYGR